VGEHIGDVLSINLHKTVIRTRENEIVMIPNDVLGREVIVNHMLPEQRIRVELEIGVAYGTDLERASELLRAVIQESDRILSEPAPEVNVASLGDNAILLQVLVWINAPRGKRRVRDAVYRRALTRFAEANIEIPFPQRVVQLTDGTPAREGYRDCLPLSEGPEGTPDRSSGSGSAASEPTGPASGKS